MQRLKCFTNSLIHSIRSKSQKKKNCELQLEQDMGKMGYDF